MIDYVKISLLNIDVDRLLNHPDIEFETKVIIRTGELPSKKESAKYHHCKIEVFDSGFVCFSGSVHKLWNSIHSVHAPNYQKENDKGFNGNQFTYIDIIEVRQHLEELFYCEPHQMKFQNIEFGVNTTPGFDPKLFVQGLLYQYNEEFEFRYGGNYGQVNHKRYRLKIYNKSRHYGMTKNTLRVEVHLKKSIEINKLGVVSFADISEVALGRAKELILNRLDELVYYDYTLNKKDLSKLKKNMLGNYSNPRFWLIELKPNQRHRHKQRLKGFIEQHSENLIGKIKDEIIKKCSIINRVCEAQKCSMINHSGILNINHTSKHSLKEPIKSESVKRRFCLVTGLDISMQKDESFLLSHTGLRYYYNTNQKVYIEIKEKYLSDKWQNVLLTMEIKELAHNIRNTHSNRQRKQQRLYPPDQVSLPIL